ncbi:MAG: cache domain-containing protein [Polyangiaceae bacterium]
MRVKLSLKYQVLALAILPLLVALAIVATLSQYQGQQLAEQQAQLIEDNLLTAKQHELQDYVALALSALAPLKESNAKEEEQQRQAKAQLGSIHYGADGYFFVYDQRGTCLVHPTMPELVGRDLREVMDSRGRHVIPDLIETARHGGGFQRYSWQKPSTGEATEKLAYVALSARWGWVVGTGAYLDDIERASRTLRARSTAGIRGTLGTLGIVSLLAVAGVFVGGLTLNASQQRMADSKLKAMAQRIVCLQEEERARVSRELHDGVSQLLVAAKFHFESARQKAQLEGSLAAQDLEVGLAQLSEGVGELRNVSHAMRPLALDQLGLSAAIGQLTEEFAQRTGTRAEFCETSHSATLPEQAALALFRIAQEALTNVERHAQASHVEVELARRGAGVSLLIKDDGRGFDVERVSQSPSSGIGLRNMRERVEHLGGALAIRSREGETQLMATVPNRARG